MSIAKGKIIYRLLADSELTAYELELLSKGKIPEALPLRFFQDREDRYIALSLGRKENSLLEKDGNKPLSQGLGLSRALQIIDAFIDLEQRLLRPSFTYLNLELIFLDETGIKFPVFPLAAHQAVRLPDTKVYPDFWYEWSGFYGVQVELAELGRKLSAEAKLQEIKDIYLEYLQKERNFTAYGLAAYREEILGLRDAHKPAKALPLDARHSALAEILNFRNGDFRKTQNRLALIAGDEFILGRDPMFTDLSFPDPWMGRKHARIRKENGHFYIEDLASLNGTYVDGRKLLRFESLLLPHHCVLKMGKTLLEFRNLQARDYFVPNNLSPASPRPGTI